MIKKYLIKVWQIGEMSLLEERIIEVEDDKWKGIVLHQPGTRATAEEIAIGNSHGNTTCDLNSEISMPTIPII